jgi:hypothetical protein
MRLHESATMVRSSAGLIWLGLIWLWASSSAFGSSFQCLIQDFLREASGLGFGPNAITDSLQFVHGLTGDSLPLVSASIRFSVI